LVVEALVKQDRLPVQMVAIQYLALSLQLAAVAVVFNQLLALTAALAEAAVAVVLALIPQVAMAILLLRLQAKATMVVLAQAAEHLLAAAVVVLERQAILTAQDLVAMARLHPFLARPSLMVAVVAEP
jgi:hypothetical protein